MQPEVQLSSYQQEKQELKHLKERFASYVNHVRQLSQQTDYVDLTSIMQTTRVLDEEIVNLKNVYEHELEKMRKEVDATDKEKITLQAYCSSQQNLIEELQNKISSETSRNSELTDRVTTLHTKVKNLDNLLQGAHVSTQTSEETLGQLQETVDDLTSQLEHWRERCQQKQLLTQETESRLHQIQKKTELSAKVHDQQVQDYQARLHLATSTLHSLESHYRQVNSSVSANDRLNQAQREADQKLHQYQTEREAEYSRKLLALQAHINKNEETLQRLAGDKSDLAEVVRQLTAKIQSLENQALNLQTVRNHLEETLVSESKQGAELVHSLENKFLYLQNRLFVERQTKTRQQDANIPVAAEIEALKLLIDEEEKRIQLQLSNLKSRPGRADSVIASPTHRSLAGNSFIRTQHGHSHTGQSQSGSCYPSLTTSQNFLTRSVEAVGPVVQSLGTASQPMDAVGPIIRSREPASSPAVVSPHADSYSARADKFYRSSGACEQELNTKSFNLLETSSLLDTLYVPQELELEEQIFEDRSYGDSDGELTVGRVSMPEIILPMTGPRYSFLSTPEKSQRSENGSLPSQTPRPVGPIPNRTPSVTIVAAEASLNMIATKHEFKTGSNRGDTNTDITNREDTTMKAENIEDSLKNIRKEADTVVPDDPQEPASTNVNSNEGENNQSEPTDEDVIEHNPVKEYRSRSSPAGRHSPFSDSFSNTSSRAIGSLKISEVDQEGRFVRLLNDGKKEFNLQDYQIKQIVHGYPVTVFSFPRNVRIQPKSTVTVWSAMNDPRVHKPPTDFLCRGQQKWNTESKITTVLCRRSGQVVAWAALVSPASRGVSLETSGKMEVSDFNENKVQSDEDTKDSGALTLLTYDPANAIEDLVCLTRRGKQLPSLLPTKHPHGSSPPAFTHPHTGQPRPLLYGNDNSTTSRQSRDQSTRPDPIIDVKSLPIRPKTSSALRTRSPGSASGSGNQVRFDVPNDQLTEEPSPFMPPHRRFETGLQQIRSQHNTEFYPPMPRYPQIS